VLTYNEAYSPLSPISRIPPHPDGIAAFHAASQHRNELDAREDR
jgi:hypothetical protein